MPYIKKSSTNEYPFISFREETYEKEMIENYHKIRDRERNRRLKGYVPQEYIDQGLYDGNLNLEPYLTPSFCQLSPYKLHVSIHSDDLTTHTENIKNILLTALENNVMHEFKIADNQLIKNQIINLKQTIEMLKTYLEHVKNNDDLRSKEPTTGKSLYPILFPSFDDEDEILSKLKELAPITHFQLNYSRNILNIKQHIDYLENDISKAERLVNSDQFTIYISTDFDQQNIFLLCLRLNDYFAQHNIREAASHSDVQSNITPHINMRQEFKLNEYNEMEKIKIYERISAIPPVNLTESEIKRRQDIKHEQEHSELYQFLKNKFLHVTSRQDKSARQSVPRNWSDVFAINYQAVSQHKSSLFIGEKKVVSNRESAAQKAGFSKRGRSGY